MPSLVSSFTWEDMSGTNESTATSAFTGFNVTAGQFLVVMIGYIHASGALTTVTMSDSTASAAVSITSMHHSI